MRRWWQGARRRTLRWLLPVVFVSLPALVLAGQLPPQLLLIVSKTDHVLELRDPHSLTLLGRAPLGPDPHEVEVSPDGRTAYVSNPGYGVFQRIDVIDLETGQAKAPLDTGPLLGPHGLSFADGKLWFTAQGSKALGRYDPQNRRFDWTMGTGHYAPAACQRRRQPYPGKQLRVGHDQPVRTAYGAAVGTAHRRPARWRQAAS